MRICVIRPNDELGWNEVKPQPHLRIYLDEKLVRQVIAVDDVRGEVFTHKKRQDGSLVIENGEPVIDRLTGSVQVRIADLSR